MLAAGFFCLLVDESEVNRLLEGPGKEVILL